MSFRGSQDQRKLTIHCVSIVYVLVSLVNTLFLAIPTYEEDVNRKELFKDNDELSKFSKLREFIPMYPVYREGEPGRPDSGYPNHPSMWEGDKMKAHAPPVPWNIGFSAPYPMPEKKDNGPKIGWRASIQGH